MSPEANSLHLPLPSLFLIPSIMVHGTYIYRRHVVLAPLDIDRLPYYTVHTVLCSQQAINANPSMPPVRTRFRQGSVAKRRYKVQNVCSLLPGPYT